MGNIRSICSKLWLTKGSILILRRLLLEGSLLAERWLGDLRRLLMELLLFLHPLHLLLLMLSRRLLLGILGSKWSFNTLLLVLRRLLEGLRLFDFFIYHDLINHTCSVLIFSPLFDLVVSAGHELVSKVQENRLGTFLDDLTADPLQWVTFDTHLLDRFVITQPVRQSDAVIIDHSESGQLREVEGQGDGNIRDAIVSNVDDFQVSELRTAQFPDVGQLVHVHV